MEEKEKVSIFIDGNNLYHSLNRINAGKIDYEKLVKELTKERILVVAFYYIAPLDITSDEAKYWKHQKFLAELEKIPKFKIVLCTLRKYQKPDGTFGFEVKGDDIYLANDMLAGAYENLYDTAILVSGDEDFIPVVNTLKKLGKKVENLYFTSSSSKNLRKTCTSYLNIRNILDKIKLEE
ncbi:NYN domain-containing protein [Candidatus Pacearchaeota archaeon]|nr:NYN domain-containing protein [Candidatus Pacearchaeota archaeon]